MTTTEKAVPESEQTTRALDASGAVGASGTHGASGAAGPSGTRAASGAAPASGTHTPSGAAPASAAQRWVGRVLSGLAVVFLLFDGLMKVLRAQPAVEGTVQLGYPESTVVGIGLILLACLALHLIPRTAVLGAILLTGYLGGAVATHVRLLIGRSCAGGRRASRRHARAAPQPALQPHALSGLCRGADLAGAGAAGRGGAAGAARRAPELGCPSRPGVRC